MTRRLLLAIAFGVILRLAFVNSPLVDVFGSMRQTYTAGYTRYMIEEGVSVSGLLNAQSIVYSHHALEIPIYNLLTVVLARVFGDVDYVYRLTSLILWVLGALYLASLLKRIYGANEALYILWVYAILPLSIFIGHYYHPEVLSVLLSVAVVFHYYFYLDKGRPHDLAISVIALAIALVVRAAHFHLYFALFFIGLSMKGWKLFKRPDTYFYILPLIPAALWSMRGSDLATETRIFQYMGSLSFRLSPKFWGMMLFHRLGGLTLSPVGLPLLVLAAAASKGRIGRAIEFAWLYAVLLFIIIVARGNFHHPHYQATMLIPAAIIIGRFLHMMATGNISDAWQRWWLAIPPLVTVAAFSLFLFFDGLVIYLFFTQPWDAEKLKTLVGNLNIPILFIIFAVSQIVLIPGIMWLWRKESRGAYGPRPANAAILIILILVSGLFVLHPVYRLDLDYIRAGEAVREFSEASGGDAQVIFSGKKDDADPFIFYSGMRGWAFNTAVFLQEVTDTPQDRAELGDRKGNRGWAFLDMYLLEDGAEYLAVMRANRYIQPEYDESDRIREELGKLKVAYEDEVVTIYTLTGVYRPASIKGSK